MERMRRPDGLDESGRKAHEVIVAYLESHKLTRADARLFYSPEEWAARGEQYGLGSKLVVAYDGAAARGCFNMDACYDAGSYEPYEELQRLLGEHGLYFEECTGWYSAVYEEQGSQMIQSVPGRGGDA